MMPLLIHSPRPVPFADLVVKKGSKRCRACSASMPTPVSQMETQVPARRSSRREQPKPASVRHGLHGVADEVEEDLLQLDGKAQNHALASVTLLDGDLVELQA